MKVNLNTGEEIECTVAEYMELKKAGMIGDIPSKPEPKKIGNRKGLKWLDSEEQFIIKHMDKGYNYLEANLPGRNIKALQNKVCKLRAEGRLKVGRMPRKDKQSRIMKSYSSPPKEQDGRVKRMSFIQKQAKYYMGQYDWDFEKARAQASEDWNNKTSLGKVGPTAKPEQLSRTDLEFPTIFPVPEQNIGQVESVVRNMLSTTKKLQYFDVKWIGLKEGEDWTGRLWIEFLNQFLLNSKKIAKAFNIKNKFKHTKINEYDVIIYDGEIKD